MPTSTGSLHIVNPLKGPPVALVAGGAGFLGSHICEKLLTSCQVICLDNLHSGKRENIKTCVLHPQFSFIEHDLARPINDLIQKRVDYIFHVAGIDEAEKGGKSSLDNLLLNTYGTRNLLEKALSDKAKFLLVSTLEHEKNIGEVIDTAQARLFSESITVEYIKKFGIDGRIIRVGHLFGPRMSLFTQNPMAIIVKALLSQKELALANDELTRIYPVFINGAVATILQTMFGTKTKGRIFNLIPKRSISLLEFSHTLADIDPHFILRFSQAGAQITVFAKEHFDKGAPLPFSSKKEFAEELLETLAYFKKDEVLSKMRSKLPFENTKGRRRFFFRRSTLVAVFVLVFFSMILPFLLICATTFIGIVHLNETYQTIGEGRFQEAARSAKRSSQFFAASQSLLHIFSYEFLLLGKGREQHGLFLLLKSGEDAATLSLQIANTGFFLGDFFEKSIQGQGRLGKQSLDRATGELHAANFHVPLVEKELEEAISLSIPKTLQNYVKSKELVLLRYRETITLAQTLIELLPDIVGFEDKRTYLVLFQNNMELRPGGGFIGSYGLVTFDKGNLTSFDIFDVYSADGQLKGHVDPPDAIRTYLAQPNWFLRDSNWDPDFQNAASQAAWFLQKEVGLSVHGVVAIDVSFVQLLLEAIGPISIPDYKETITKDNLFEKAETHAEADFFPGSAQKKDFLGALNRRIIDRLLHDTHTPWLSVFSSVKKGVAEKHLLFSFNNPSIQKVFTVNNWGGSILSVPQKEGFGDFRMISEANLGMNKVNAFVKRKASDEILIGDKGEISGTLSIQYSNDGPHAYPGGSYTNYLRVLFPQNTKLTSIAFDGKEASVSAKPKDGGFPLEEATASGKSIFGFLVTIPAKTTKLVSLSYRLPSLFPPLPGSSTYSYIFQKQPGVKDDPLTVTINYPQDLHIQKTNAQVFQEPHVVVLSTDLSEDRLFEVEFLR